VLYRLISGRPPRVFPDAAGYAAAALRGDPVPHLREVSGTPAWLADAVMAMLDPDPASRPGAADCVRLLSDTPALAPAAVQALVGQAPVGQQPVGQQPVGQQPVGQPGGAGPGSFGGAGQPHATIAMTSPAATRAPAGRPRRPGLVAAVIGGVIALLVAGSLVALRFYGSPPSTGSAAGSTSAPAASGAVTTPAAPAATSRPASAAASAPAHASPASHSATPTASATASATSSAPASTAPALVPVPDVVGMTFTKAWLVLTGDGFKVASRHPRVGQIVTSTSPSGRAPAGSVIIVTYGTGI
jgi:hypothetical protein